MIHRSQDQSAISSVIGVILMVALTVMLAAVLGQFVLDMVGLLEQPPQAGVTFQTDSATASDPIDDSSVSNCGGDAFDCYKVTTVVTSMPNADTVTIRASSGPGAEISETGDSVERYYKSGTTLTVVAEKAGSSQVVQFHTVAEE